MSGGSIDVTNNNNKIIKPCSRLSTVRGQPHYHAHKQGKKTM